MQTFVILAAFLLFAGVSAEQPQEVPNTQSASVPVQVDQQPSHVVGHTSAVESASPQSGMPVGHSQHFTGGQVANFEQQMPPSAPHYYSPSGIIQVVGPQGASNEQQQQQAAAAAAGAGGGSAMAKPGVVQTVRHYAAGAGATGAAGATGGPEQYGQPESASIPPNYKPFGSWGLYIGGNPADGYYSNYYKALSNSVADKQQVAVGGAESPVKPQPFVGHATEFGSSGVPVTMKQGPVYPQTVAYQDQSYYPYGEYYTPADFNSGSRVTVQNQMIPSVYSSAFPVDYQQQQQQMQMQQQQQIQPQQGPQQQPAAMYYGAESYAVAPASRKGGSTAAFAQKDVQVPMSPAAKGYQQQQQQRMGYAYATQGAYQQQQQQGHPVIQQASYQPQPQSQIVAYPVPVGSQMVGSQPGTEGAYQPYGVHGFTRYAVKPTVVSAEQAYYQAGMHSSPVSQFPVYKQQFVGYQQPMSFYGYPLSQLHYATGAVSPVFGGSQASQMMSSGAPIQVSGGGGPAGSPVSAYSAGGVQQSSPQVGATVVEHSGPVMSVEAASSEKSETSSQIEKHVGSIASSITNNKQQHQPQQHQPQQHQHQQPQQQQQQQKRA